MILHHLMAAAIKIENTEVGVPEVAANDTAVNTVINTVFIALGSIAILLILIGALRYVISQGNQSSTKQAKDTILYALIGLVVSLLAFLIVQLVLGVIYG